MLPSVIVLIIIVISVAILVQYLDLDLPEIPFFPKKENEVISITGKIAFISSRDGQNDIYIMDTDGSNVTRLTKTKLGGSCPSWSSDGEKIAFSSGINLPGTGIHIYVVDVRGGKLIKLTKSPNTVNEYPAWSSDGKRIAFASATLKKNDIGQIGQYDICVMNADGSNATKLTENGGFYPTWSPDGKRIAYFLRHEDHYYIYIMNSDGSNQTKLIKGLYPDWSPDGKTIVFSSSEWPQRIGVINVDGGGLIWLTHPLEITLPDGKVSSAKDVSPKWSPDGKTIAFQSTRNGNWDIYLMSANGRNMIRLTDSPEHDMCPTWSPP